MSIDCESDIEKLVIKTVTSVLKIPEHSISYQTEFVADLGVDSIDLIELMMSFEAEFGCEIPDTEVQKLKNIEDVVSYIRQNVR
jgi:acyl carrier protein